jgi:hypothetical protein
MVGVAQIIGSEPVWVTGKRSVESQGARSRRSRLDVHFLHVEPLWLDPDITLNNVWLTAREIVAPFRRALTAERMHS